MQALLVACVCVCACTHKLFFSILLYGCLFICNISLLGMIALIVIKVTPLCTRSCFSHLLAHQEELYSMPSVCFRLSICICLAGFCFSISKKQVCTIVWSISSHLRDYFVIFPHRIFFILCTGWAVIQDTLVTESFCSLKDPTSYVAVLGSDVIN